MELRPCYYDSVYWLISFQHVSDCHAPPQEGINLLFGTGPLKLGQTLVRPGREWCRMGGRTRDMRFASDVQEPGTNYGTMGIDVGKDLVSMDLTTI